MRKVHKKKSGEKHRSKVLVHLHDKQSRQITANWQGKKEHLF